MENQLAEILKRVRRTIFNHRMIQPGDRIVVAVSGGPDSVSLLDILNGLREELRIDLIVAHFDHRLRPAEDDAETRFVSALSLAYGLPYETAQAKDLRLGGGSLEEKARQARYLFLSEVKATHAAQKIAMGHTLNDQAETVLMRMLRGSGPAGLAGIPPFRDKEIMRPLIELSRDEIYAYLSGKGLSYAMDSSNLDRCHLRNQVRLEILPFLRGYQPRIIEILGRMADIMRADEALLVEKAGKWVEMEAGVGEDDSRSLPAAPFRALPGPLRTRVIREILREVGGSLRGVSRFHIESVEGLAMGGRPQAEVHLPNRLAARKRYDRILITPLKKRKPEPFFFLLEGPGVYPLDRIGYTLTLQAGRDADFHEMGQDPWTVLMDRDKVFFPLGVRNFRPGDRFVPLGMGGHKKVKDLFIELKIPSSERGRIPILTQEDKPVWVCGLRLDDRFKVTGETRNMLKAVLMREMPLPELPTPDPGI